MNYQIKSIGDFASIQRADLKEQLGFTSCEISINTLEANSSVPFVHHHKENEEVYLILDGEGKIKLDNELINIKKGDVLRLAPSVKRQIFATSKLNYICIQAKENSLQNYTFTDGVVEE